MTGGSEARPRPTAPVRDFGPDQLAAMNADELRALCQLLLVSDGAQIRSVHASGAYSEWLIEIATLWRRRTGRARLFHERVAQPSVDRLSAVAAEEDDAETVLIAAHGVEPEVDVPATIHVVAPDELIRHLLRSPLVRWQDHRPAPALDRWETQLSLEDQTALLDPVGIRWLPLLALNELPPEIQQSTSLTPEDLLEQVAFRLLTASLRFGGIRYGNRERGQRLPDALLLWPHTSNPFAALFDAKASADGYTMPSDHALRFAGYIETMRGNQALGGNELRYLIVLSSSFPGRSGGNHPYHGRADALGEETGIKLVYIRADDLAQASARIEVEALGPAVRESIDWGRVFDEGMVSGTHLQEAISAATG